MPSRTVSSASVQQQPREAVTTAGLHTTAFKALASVTESELNTDIS